MGSLRRRTGDEVEPRRANHDAVNRTALQRSAWRNLGGADRFGCRWRIPSAISLVDHGWTIRRKISKCSVLHDVAYGEHKRPWQDCDRMFYYAMRCSGVGATEAKTMYYALYKFGHHWKFPIKRAKPVKYEGALVARGEEIPRAVPVDPAQITQARTWISNTDPSLEQIEQRAQTEGW